MGGVIQPNLDPAQIKKKLTLELSKAVVNQNMKTVLPPSVIGDCTRSLFGRCNALQALPPQRVLPAFYFYYLHCCFCLYLLPPFFLFFFSIISFVPLPHLQPE